MLIPTDFVKVDFNEAPSGGFYICIHPVTQEEYSLIVGKNPSHFIAPNNPVEQVSWFDAIEYCNKRSEKEGLDKCYSKDSKGNWSCDFTKNGYRLPTSAEWEWAAKGGNKSKGYKYSGRSLLQNSI